MDRRTRNLLAIAVALVVLVTGGAAALFGGAGQPGPAAVAEATSVVGVVVGVNSGGIDKVRGFTLRTQGGSTVEFAIGSLENGEAFPPGHLVEHQATAQQVRVWYRIEGDGYVAVRLEDVP